MWEDRNNAGLSATTDSTAGKGWMDHIKGFTSISTLKQEAIELIKANVDTIMSVSAFLGNFAKVALCVRSAHLHRQQHEGFIQN